MTEFRGKLATSGNHDVSFASIQWTLTPSQRSTHRAIRDLPGYVRNRNYILGCVVASEFDFVRENESDISFLVIFNPQGSAYAAYLINGSESALQDIKDMLVIK